MFSSTHALLLRYLKHIAYVYICHVVAHWILFNRRITVPRRAAGGTGCSDVFTKQQEAHKTRRKPCAVGLFVICEACWRMFADVSSTDSFYDVVTVGAPAAHSQGFKNGGLQKLLNKYESEKKRSVSTCSHVSLLIALLWWWRMIFWQLYMKPWKPLFVHQTLTSILLYR